MIDIKRLMSAPYEFSRRGRESSIFFQTAAQRSRRYCKLGSEASMIHLQHAILEAQCTFQCSLRGPEQQHHSSNCQTAACPASFHETVKVPNGLVVGVLRPRALLVCECVLHRAAASFVCTSSCTTAPLRHFDAYSFAIIVVSLILLGFPVQCGLRPLSPAWV